MDNNTNNINKQNNQDELILDGIKVKPKVYKTEEKIIEEEANHDEYNRRHKEKMLEDLKKRQEKLDEDRAMFHTIETNGWDGLDGGQNWLALSPDSMGRKLTRSEILFCRYYVCTNNIKQSLKLAGLDATNAQMKIIHKPEIRAFISELTDLRLKQLGYDRTTVLKNLAIIANQDVTDYLDIVKTQKKAKDGSFYTRTDIEIKDLNEVNKSYVTDEFGEVLLDENGNPILISSEKTKAIKSVRYNDNGQVTLEFHDKMGALKQLANMLDLESPTKITLNDETKRAQTEQSILKKLQALAGDSSNSEEETNKDKVESVTETTDNISDDKPKEA